MGRFEVMTVSGDITLQQIDASGNVHIESSSGNIQLQIAVRVVCRLRLYEFVVFNIVGGS